MVSIFSRSAGEMAALWLKSNRSLVGATSDPFWSIWSPRTSRRQKLRIWVAVWLFRRGHRRSCASDANTRQYRLDPRRPQRPTHLAVRASDLVPDLDLALLHEPDVQDVSIEHLHIGHLEVGLAIDRQRARVVLLSTGFGVKVGLVEQDPEGRSLFEIRGGVDKLGGLVDPLDGPGRVPEQELGRIIGLGDRVVLFQDGEIVHVQLDRLLALGLAPSLARLVTVLLGLFKGLLVDGETPFLGHQPGQIAGEPKGVVQSPDIDTVQGLGPSLGGLGSVRVEEGLSSVQRPGEGFFLLVQDLLQVGVLAVELGEKRSELLDDGRAKAGEKGPDLDAKLATGISSASSQDSSKDVTTTDIAGHTSVADGDGQGPDVIGQDSVGGIESVLVVLAELARVGSSAGHLLDLVKVGLEDVGVVVGFHVLQARDESLEPHPGVDMLSGEGSETPVVFSVVGHEDVVPHFEDVGVVLVDEMSGVSASDSVEMDLAARSTGTDGAHLPKVVLDVSGENVILLDADIHPELSARRRLVSCSQTFLLGSSTLDSLGLEIRLQTKLFVPLEIGDIQPIRRQPIDPRQKVPTTVDGLLFEIVAKRPVPQHFEKGVMVRVFTDVVQVVVLSTGSDTLLRVDGSFEGAHLGVGVGGTEEEGFILVHTLNKTRMLIVSLMQTNESSFVLRNLKLTALANNSVGSSKGITLLLGQKVCSRPGLASVKYLTKVSLTLAAGQDSGEGQAWGFSSGKLEVLRSIRGML